MLQYVENQSKKKVNLCETSMRIGQHPICLMYKIGVFTGFITLGGIIHNMKVSLAFISV